MAITKKLFDGNIGETRDAYTDAVVGAFGPLSMSNDNHDDESLYGMWGYAVPPKAEAALPPGNAPVTGEVAKTDYTKLRDFFFGPEARSVVQPRLEAAGCTHEWHLVTIFQTPHERCKWCDVKKGG